MRCKAITLTFVFALGAACNTAACGGFSDGLFVAHGLVLDGNGRAVPNVTVRARTTSVISDQQGCFTVRETTYPGRHEMPLSVSATGFKPFTGTVTAPNTRRMRVSLAETTSTASTVVDSSPKPGALGACEAPPRESAEKR